MAKGPEAAAELEWLSCGQMYLVGVVVWLFLVVMAARAMEVSPGERAVEDDERFRRLHDSVTQCLHHLGDERTPPQAS